jgi:hypothetical protein
MPVRTSGDGADPRGNYVQRAGVRGRGPLVARSFRENTPYSFAMADTWITDITDYLDERGALVSTPGPARRLAEHLGAIVVAVTREPFKSATASAVRCRRRPNRKPCLGHIRAALTLDGDMDIVWECPSCGDNGRISNWHGTMWDCLDIEPGEGH